MELHLLPINRNYIGWGFYSYSDLHKHSYDLSTRNEEVLNYQTHR